MRSAELNQLWHTLKMWEHASCNCDPHHLTHVYTTMNLICFATFEEYGCIRVTVVVCITSLVNALSWTESGLRYPGNMRACALQLASASPHSWIHYHELNHLYHVWECERMCLAVGICITSPKNVLCWTKSALPCVRNVRASALQLWFTSAHLWMHSPELNQLCHVRRMGEPPGCSCDLHHLTQERTLLNWIKYIMWRRDYGRGLWKEMERYYHWINNIVHLLVS